MHMKSFTSGKYVASCCCSGISSINGNTNSGLKISANPKPLDKIKVHVNSKYETFWKIINL